MKRKGRKSPKWKAWRPRGTVTFQPSDANANVLLPLKASRMQSAFINKAIDFYRKHSTPTPKPV